MILVAWATYLLVGGALKPVERIRSRVASISTKQLDERVPPVPPTGDEIARLAETMNEMLARLESGHLAQRRFVSDASHELRSPLAAISTALELAHARPEMLDLALLDDSLIPEATRMRELIETCCCSRGPTNNSSAAARTTSTSTTYSGGPRSHGCRDTPG